MARITDRYCRNGRNRATSKVRIREEEKMAETASAINNNSELTQTKSALKST